MFSKLALLRRLLSNNVIYNTPDIAEDLSEVSLLQEIFNYFLNTPDFAQEF